MRKFLLAFVVLFASTSAVTAASRYDTRSLSCSRIQSILKSERVAMLRFPSRRGNIVYDFYTFNTGRCSTGGSGRRTSIPAADTRSCRVYRCERVFTNGR